MHGPISGPSLKLKLKLKCTAATQQLGSFCPLTARAMAPPSQASNSAEAYVRKR